MATDAASTPTTIGKIAPAIMRPIAVTIVAPIMMTTRPAAAVGVNSG